MAARNLNALVLSVLIAFLMSHFAKGLVSNRGKSFTSSASTSPSGKNLFVQWFRGADLRLHDNPALCKTIELAQRDQAGVIFLYCFDPRVFAARSKFGSLKCGPKRAKFILESVADLRHTLEERGSGLLVAYGKPEDIIIRLLKDDDNNKSSSLTIPHVVCQDEVCSEELAVEKAVRNAIAMHHPKATLTKVWGSTLYNKDDLPFNDGPFGIPDTFTPFRARVEAKCKIDKPLPVPNKGDLKMAAQMTSSSMIDKNCSLQYMPTLMDLGYTSKEVEFANEVDERGVLDFRGGESAALARVKEYMWEKDLLRVYFDTRNGMLGGDYSTKFAPWLAMGCLSPRFVASECRRYEEERISNKSTYWVVLEMLIRDFFKFFALKHGTKLFFQGGTMGSAQKWTQDAHSVQVWKDGMTGYPLVDANMRELAASGFMSNRGRQNVASFLALDMHIDWRYGADYFEEMLLDYDVHSNWVNWCNAAGMTGGRVNRFNIVKQSKDYDQHGDYVRHWLPELKDVPTTFVHEPWKMSLLEQTEFNCRLGVDYPNPIVAPFEPIPRGDEKNKGRRKAAVGKEGDEANKNRGKGQRHDMKSLKTGQFLIG